MRRNRRTKRQHSPFTLSTPNPLHLSLHSAHLLVGDSIGSLVPVRVPDPPDEVVAHRERHAEFRGRREPALPDRLHHAPGVPSQEGDSADSSDADGEDNAGYADGYGGEGDDGEGVDHDVGGDGAVEGVLASGVVLEEGRK